EDGIRDDLVTGVQTCALPISLGAGRPRGPLLTGGPVRRVGAAPVARVQRALTSFTAPASRPAGAARAAGTARAASIHDSRQERKIGRASCRERVERQGRAVPA